MPASAKSKYAVLDGFKDAPTETPEPLPANGRKVLGKRSNPAFKQVSVLLRVDSRRQAMQILFEDKESGGLDFSMLLQSLLDKWLLEV